MVERDLSADLAFALELADAAAAITMSWFGHRLPVELKADATPVTEVDRAAEHAIRAAIAARFPGDGVLGEEEGLRRRHERPLLGDRSGRRDEALRGGDPVCGPR